MRILKNIYNEFIIYHDRILSKENESQTEQQNKVQSDSALLNLDINKLLGIVVYKNIFPKDFSDLHLRKGFMFTLFNTKSSLIEQEVKRLNLKIGEIEEMILSSEDEMLESINELDAIYFKFHPQITSVGNKSISEFNNQTQLIKEMKDNPTNINVRVNNGYNVSTLNITSELEKLEQNPEYIKRKRAIERKSSNQIEKLKSTLQELIKQKSTLQNRKLKEFISKDNINNIFSISYTNEIGDENQFNEIKGSNYFPLIKYLVRYGYIDESYSDYMTYFYENSLNRVDKNFLLSVTDQIPKDYSYSLNDPDKVISRLRLSHFYHAEILNFDLLNHLLITKSINAKYLSSFLEQLKETKNFQFIGGFLDLGKDKELKLFIEEINKMWPTIFQSIIDESDFSHNQKKQYSVYSLYYSSDVVIEHLNKRNNLTNFISNSHDFLDIESPDIEKLIAGFSLLGVKFEWINYAESNIRLFQEVYHNNLYKLTFNNICLMLEKAYGLVKSEDFKNKNFTLVISEQDEPLAQYVNSNFNHYIKEILENCNERITDEESVALSIINHTEVDTKDKSAYIRYLDTVIQHIDSVKDIDIWALLLQEQVVEYSENNILNYFFHHELDSYLIDFVNESDCQLEFESKSIDNTFGENSASKFFKALVNNNELTNERYESILKTFDRHYNAFSNTEIEEDKMQILIKINTLRMTEENLIFMRESYRSLLLFFIKHNIRQYTEDVINEENFEMDEVLSLLDKNVEDKYKISLLKFSSDVITLKEKDYSDSVKLHILENNLNGEDIPLLLDNYPHERNKTIVDAIKTISIQSIEDIITEQYSVPFELLVELFLEGQLEMKTKKELFAQHLPNMSKKQVVKSLRTLQMEDFLSLFERKRPTFEINDVNETILDNFKERKWITTFYTDENNTELFRAIGRDRSDILASI
ncbi:hypothetical protein E3U55_14355 [Filobacillus milosensis]|uniref:Uncharacterized protein n=1 Tax=Filobacillus milosensis TaxID=94137 RepID=A0A4Y8IDS5_9BACI|nr:hypothetical protein E3U55_14355 [Filobacillus milosensis]